MSTPDQLSGVSCNNRSRTVRETEYQPGNEYIPREEHGTRGAKYFERRKEGETIGTMQRCGRTAALTDS